MNVLYTSLISALLTLYSRAEAEPLSVDPKQYLDEKAFEESKKDSSKDPSTDLIQQNVVSIDGRPYYKFGTDKASILVPKTDNLSKADFERAVCSEDLKEVCDPNKVGMDSDATRKELCAVQGLSNALGTRAEFALSDKTSFYLDLIVTTIQTTCGGTDREPNAKNLMADLEIGIAWKNKDPRHPGEQKVFIKPLPFRPTVGAGVSF